MSSEQRSSTSVEEHSAAAPHHWLLSIALGAVLFAFFADSFVRDEAYLALAVVLALSAFLIIGIIVIADGSTARRPRLDEVLVATAGALAVFGMTNSLGVSSTFAASIVGVVAGVLPRVTSRISARQAAPLYVGAFAGMTSPVILMGWTWVVIAGLATGCLWSVVRDAWVGVGGKMGLIAFAGSIVALQVARLAGATDQLGEVPTFPPAHPAVVVLAGVVATLLTHWLAYERGWGPVLASAITTLVFVVLLVGVTTTIALPTDAAAAAWFGGTFVGMTSPTRLPDRRWALLAMGLLFGFLVNVFESHLAGLGGDLGATAAAAVISVIGLAWLPRLRALRHRSVLAHRGH